MAKKVKKAKRYKPDTSRVSGSAAFGGKTLTAWWKSSKG